MSKKRRRAGKEVAAGELFDLFFVDVCWIGILGFCKILFKVFFRKLFGFGLLIGLIHVEIGVEEDYRGDIPDEGEREGGEKLHRGQRMASLCRLCRSSHLRIELETVGAGGGRGRETVVM